MILFLILFGLSGCGNSQKVEETFQKETTSSVSMKEVPKKTQKSEMDDGEKQSSTETSFSERETAKTQEALEQEKKLSKQEVLELLKCVGNGFANFSNIKERNEKLRPFVTEECAKANGFDFDSVCQLPSSGKIKEIYMPLEKENHYALVLDCVQNGAPVKLLILVEITGDKISHIDYNDVRESY
ncbi:hypothetical protein GHK79_04675 [Enterococcus faecium]|nr:hypothetical protein [Enterococcus faecium]MBL3707121.1 hypothetical protein [Enterococcus faecium]